MTGTHSKATVKNFQKFKPMTTLAQSQPTAIAITYVQDDVMSGTLTRAMLQAKKTGEIIKLEILSIYPLTMQALRHAISQATGRTHWDFKIQDLAAVDYEF